MKLVRVLSKEDQATASFSNLFTDQITISPYSQVALINASLSLTTLTVDVTSANNSMSIKQASIPSVTVTIPTGTYGSAAFVKLLSAALNQGLTVGSSGLMFQSSLSANNVLQISFRVGKDATNTSDVDAVYSNMEFQSSKYQPTANPNNNVDKTWVYASPAERFIQGAGKLSVKMANTKGILGLISTTPAAGDSVLISDIKYGIRHRADGFYSTILNGVETISTVTYSELTDTAQFLRLSQGKITFLITRSSSDIVINSAVNYSYEDTALIPIILVESYGNFSQWSYNRDPFENSLFINNVSRNITITLPTGTRNLLGYADSTLSESTNDKTFVADNPLVDTTPPVSLSVELPQLGSMESYDGKTERRAQLVSVIPSLVKTNQDMSYNAPYPIFVDINNAYDLVLSSLEVRVLDSATNLPVALENPACSLTFAFKTRKE